MIDETIEKMQQTCNRTQERILDRFNGVHKKMDTIRDKINEVKTSVVKITAGIVVAGALINIFLIVIGLLLAWHKG